jgi:hypothetical protein
MQLTKDWREFIESLNSNKVDYLIVGAVALAWHGNPRMTGDIDILLQPTPANAERVKTALEQFGFGQLGISTDDLTRPNQIIQLGFPPNRIDLITSITGVDNVAAWASCVKGELEGMRVNIIGVEELIRNKQATGRPKDIADAAILRQRNPRT